VQALQFLAKAAARGLGDRKTICLGLALIALGGLGKLALPGMANIETVLVASLVAGSLLGRWWTVVVPLGAILLQQLVAWESLYPGHGAEVIAGITFFVATGYLFVGVAGRRLKPRMVARVGSVALLTTVSVPLTIAYDLWTDVGEWYFIARPVGVDFWTVLQLQVPFTAYHIISSLVFVPLFGSVFLWAQAYLTHRSSSAPSPADEKSPVAEG